MFKKTITITVNDRIFLLGLTCLFRELQKEYEAETLYPIVEKCVQDLRLNLVDFPIEGYYTESDILSKYFLLIKNLQSQEIDKQAQIVNQEEFFKLLDYCGSQIFGISERKFLLPTLSNPFTQILKNTDVKEWNIPNLREKSYQYALNSDDYSLVGLACLSKDEITITYSLESTVLYSSKVIGAGLKPIEYNYLWKVSPEIEKRARLFVTEFNNLTGLILPKVIESNADIFAKASPDPDTLALTCINFGEDVNHIFYHWVIDQDEVGKLLVRDFWDKKLWTTEVYKKEHQKL